MALIIKGDMPKGCCWYDEEGHCIRCFHLFDCEQGTPYDAVRPSDCPILGEIPDKHGRLIDADRLKGVIRKANEDCMFVGKYERAKQWSDAEFYVDHAPTVLEAST